MPDLLNLSASSAVEAMRNGSLKAEDYAEALLDRSKELESLNAFRAIEPERVLEAARAADKLRAAGKRLGMLHGLPIPVKDSVNTEDYVTTNGTAALRDFQPNMNAAIVDSLSQHGATVMGKTNLHELSLGWTSDNATYGAVQNPFVPGYSPGGSSGGSAAAVAARMAPLAIAEDTLGSIRIPASMCGICGFRPTYNRYPNQGIMPLTIDKFDQVGPVARSVEDLILFDSAITGELSPPAKVDLSEVRVGIPDYFYEYLEPEAEKLTLATLDKLRQAGVTLVDVAVPSEVRAVAKVVNVIIAYEMRQSITDFLQVYKAGVTLDRIAESAGPDVKALLNSSEIPEDFYKNMLVQRETINAAINKLFEEESLSSLAFPPVLRFPQKIGEDGRLEVNGKQLTSFDTLSRNASLSSCAGMPSLVLPSGLNSTGLPLGMEFCALPGNDRQLLAIGLELQDILGAFPSPIFRPERHF